jgi:hypothetical protein
LAAPARGRIVLVTIRRLLALVASLAMTGALVTATAAGSSARTVDDRCLGRAPIPVEALPALDAAGCALVGRLVTAGRSSVTVPPAGMSVIGDGVGRHGDVVGLALTNTGGSVRTIPADRAAPDTRGASARRADPPACKDRTFHLEHHKWTSRLRYHINLKGLPKRLHKKAVISQVKIANGNMRKGRNTCHKPRLKTPHARYLGKTRIKPDIKPNTKTHADPSCGRGNTKNVVGFANLPGGLLGWTCIWVWNNGHTAGADILIDNGKYLVTKLPKTCRAKWDFEGTVTHEWGHAYGMAHTGSGHGNLTMQHELAPCSTYARTLGLGDWLGMNKMYGHKHR